MSKKEVIIKGLKCAVCEMEIQCPEPSKYRFYANSRSYYDETYNHPLVDCVKYLNSRLNEAYNKIDGLKDDIRYLSNKID